MKRHLSKLLGLLASAFLFGLIAAPSQAAVTETQITHTNTRGTWTCLQRNGGNYADNGHYYYCGDPNLPVNHQSDKDSYMTALQQLPAYTQTQMSSQGVNVYVFCTAAEYQIYFDQTISLPAGATPRTLASFFDPVAKNVVVLQYQTDTGQSCSTPTGTGSANKFAIYNQGNGLMRHEIGHFIDRFENVPAGQYKHSVNDSTLLYRKYLQKDIDYMNDQTRAGAYIPCVNIFKNAFDTFSYSDPQPGDPNHVTTAPICSGTTLNAHLAGFSNFQIMSTINNMVYFLTRYVDPTGGTQTTWRELFPETFPYSVGTVGTGPSGTTASDFYLKNDYFKCSKIYVQTVSKTGNPPQPADLTGSSARCALP